MNFPSRLVQLRGTLSHLARARLPIQPREDFREEVLGELDGDGGVSGGGVTFGRGTVLEVGRNGHGGGDFSFFVGEFEVEAEGGAFAFWYEDAA